MASGSFGSGRTSVSPTDNFPSYTFLEALEKVGVTPAEAYWLGLPIPHVADSIIDNRRALGGFTGSNSQFSGAATRSYSPSYGLIHSSYSNNHLMAAYPSSVLIRNPTPAVGRCYARNPISPYPWSSIGYNNRSLSDAVGFGYANPGYVHEAATNFAGTFTDSSYQNQYALQPANYSGFPNHQLQPAYYSGFPNHQLQPANYTGSQEFGPVIRPVSDIPFVYDIQQPNGTRLADPLASLFEQDPRQHTSTILCNTFEQPPAIAQAASTPPFVADENGYLYEFRDLDYFPQDLVEPQDTSSCLLDANMGMDEYFERGDYLLDDIDGFDTPDPSDLFID